MLALVGIYFWTILAGSVTAPALALLGTQLATRDRAMQTLCVGQGATFGVLLGVGLFHRYETTWLWTFGPFLTALSVSALTYMTTDRLVAHKTASKNTLFMFVFSLLMAASYLITALLPGLENHLTQIYFGDLATLTEDQAQRALVGGLILLTLMVGLFKRFSHQSFEVAIFGEGATSGRRDRSSLVFKVLSLLTLCLSVQFIGFLFTVAMLFLPTALTNNMRIKGLTRHVALCTSVALISTPSGFLFSLAVPELQTVPTIVVAMFLFSMCVIAVERIYIFLRGLSFSGSVTPERVAVS